MTLAEQFVAAMGAIAARRVPLSAIGGWLVTAATLLALRARLLLPPSSAEAREAEREAAGLRRQLASRAQVQAGAAWLGRQPQLGREVFGRGARLPDTAGPPVADATELLRACLRLLQLSPRERVYRPHPPPLWRAPDALDHLRAMLGHIPGEGVLLASLVPLGHARIRSPLQRRAALASTTLADLELAREGEVQLQQAHAFGPMTLVPVGAVASVPRKT